MILSIVSFGSIMRFAMVAVARKVFAVAETLVKLVVDDMELV